MTKEIKTITREGLFGDIKVERAPGHYTAQERREIKRVQRLNPGMSQSRAWLIAKQRGQS